MMPRLNPAFINVLIGIVIGLCIAFLFLPTGTNFAIRTPLSRITEQSSEHLHKHDAHNDEEVDDAHAPQQAMHFHSGNNSLHHGESISECKLIH
jgi:uncharacterized membrane protein YccC